MIVPIEIVYSIRGRCLRFTLLSLCVVETHKGNNVKRKNEPDSNTRL